MAAVFCVVSCVNTGPYHGQDRFLMAGAGQGEVLGYLLQFRFAAAAAAAKSLQSCLTSSKQ